MVEKVLKNVEEIIALKWHMCISHLMEHIGNITYYILVLYATQSPYLSINY